MMSCRRREDRVEMERQQERERERERQQELATQRGTQEQKQKRNKHLGNGSLYGESDHHRLDRRPTLQPSNSSFLSASTPPLSLPSSPSNTTTIPRLVLPSHHQTSSPESSSASGTRYRGDNLTRSRRKRMSEKL